MSDNKHYGTSELILNRVETEIRWYWGVGVNTGDAEAVARAQVQATLALAYEQRTANLIAMAQMEHRNDTGIGFDPDYNTEAIYERLGLS